MSFSSVAELVKSGLKGKGPVALIFAEDEIEIDSTVEHHLLAGFETIVLFADASLPRSEETEATALVVDQDITGITDVVDSVNAMIPALAGRWTYYGYNAEYLFHPFCEARTIGELTAFLAEERRDSMLTFVVDLYAGNLDNSRDGVNTQDAYFDRSGYYALQRTDKWNNPKARQMDFYGGLRWRYEEHIDKARRRIDRVGVFKAKPGLTLRPDHTFSDPEYNTFACEWHHSPTATICSFRTAKALKRNAGSTFAIQNFQWHNSQRFEWSSEQLFDLGLMEPGQWF